MADPTGTLTRAIIEKWQASAALEGVVAGPYNREKPTGSPSAVPYCIMRVSTTRTHTTNENDYWRGIVEFDLYDTDILECESQSHKVLAVFDSDALKSSFSMDEGHLLNQRLVYHEYLQPDKTVYLSRMRYQFNFSRPRVA
jgi:hypothetical protein